MYDETRSMMSLASRICFFCSTEIVGTRTPFASRADSVYCRVKEVLSQTKRIGGSTHAREEGIQQAQDHGDRVERRMRVGVDALLKRGG